VETIRTAPAGTVLNGGSFTVPDALGNKIIHPFGDFLLHFVGTGDGRISRNQKTPKRTERTNAAIFAWRTPTFTNGLIVAQRITMSVMPGR
jgi:hypothetical protein